MLSVCVTLDRFGIISLKGNRQCHVTETHKIKTTTTTSFLLSDQWHESHNAIGLYYKPNSQGYSP